MKINSNQINMAILIAIIFYRKKTRKIWYKEKINMAIFIAILVVKPLGLMQDLQFRMIR
jgi:hypothetical protein